MADDKKNSKRVAIDNAGEKVKGAFTGEDGSVFWACKEIYNALKVGLHALNTQLSRAGRAVAEIQEKSLNGGVQSSDVAGEERGAQEQNAELNNRRKQNRSTRPTQ